MEKTKAAWPPDYTAEFAERVTRLNLLRAKPHRIHNAKQFYRANPHEFIEHWGVTYDPRNAGTEKPTTMPFIMFPKQHELIDFLLACLEADADGLDEKCRDMGATWICVAFSVWLWLYWDGAAVGWGSRKQEYVDRLGDADSIFEKIRIYIRNLPKELLPLGFDPNNDMPFMKIVNPETGASITGEVGDNIGRGGRKRIYFKDESAHYEHPELVEAALGDNTRCQIDISSVNGLGNVFHRKREAGVEWRPGQPALKNITNVFVMDWSDHPAKTMAWYMGRKKKATADGLLHVFEQEVNRNYAASVVGTIIPLEWIQAAVDAHLVLGFDDDGGHCAALDVADSAEGDTNALAIRKGVVLRSCDQWGERDTGMTARRAIAFVSKLTPINLQYDCIGVGSGIKSEGNRLKDEDLLPKGLRLVPWDAGAGPQDPEGRVVAGDKDSPLNKDFYGNVKAQGWWMLRRRFENTYRAVMEPGFTWNADDLISLDSRIPLLMTIMKELAQPVKGETGRLKMIVQKAPEGTRSPNLADAIMMCYWPMKVKGPLVVSKAVLRRSAVSVGR